MHIKVSLYKDIINKLEVNNVMMSKLLSFQYMLMSDCRGPSLNIFLTLQNQPSDVHHYECL